MSPHVVLAITALIVVLLVMVGELVLSRAHERVLLRDGAVEPPDPVYSVMRWVYPLTFVAMTVEGAMSRPGPAVVTWAGAGVLVLAKALKFWAIVTLGTRWTYRVLIMRGVPLISRGPYRWMRHPNYAGVIGELIGMALLVHAPVSGLFSVTIFAYLLRQRIAAEEDALGLS